jgi:hypothetical protein
MAPCHGDSAQSRGGLLHITFSVKTMNVLRTSISPTPPKFEVEHNYIYVNSVRTSQQTHHVSATEPNRLLLCGETVAVCCENRTEHTDTLCGQSVPHWKHATSPLQSPTG